MANSNSKVLFQLIYSVCTITTHNAGRLFVIWILLRKLSTSSTEGCPWIAGFIRESRDLCWGLTGTAIAGGVGISDGGIRGCKEEPLTQGWK